jgi:hypothetical protein
MKMEELQEQRFALERQVTQHGFKMTLFKDFLELQKQQVSEKIIRRNFPDMVPFLNDNEDSSDDETDWGQK